MSFKLSMLASAATVCLSAAAVAQAPNMHVVGPSATAPQPDSKAQAKAKAKADAKADTKAGADAQANVAADANGAPADTAVAADTAANPPTSQVTAPGQAGTAPGQAGTTPGQAQSTPGQASELTPAVTGQTPSGQATAQGENASAAKAATKADVKAGATVVDASGNTVGKIDSVKGNSAVLNTGKVQVTIPLTSLAANDKGLAIGMSKAEIEAAAAKKK